MALKIEKVWVFIATDPEGGEGVVGMRIGDVMMPMIGADRERAEALRPAALQIGMDFRCKIELRELGNVLSNQLIYEPPN